MISFAFQEDLIGNRVGDVLERVKATEVVCGKGNGNPQQGLVLRLRALSRVKKK